jgi:hypothetical protein
MVHAEDPEQIVGDLGSKTRQQILLDHDIGVAAQKLGELGPDFAQVEQRELLRRRHADQHVDVAVRAGVAARQRPEQRQLGNPERAQRGLVRADRADHALALGERRGGGCEIRGHGEAHGATRRRYRRRDRL